MVIVILVIDLVVFFVIFGFCRFNISINFVILFYYGMNVYLFLLELGDRFFVWLLFFFLMILIWVRNCCFILFLFNNIVILLILVGLIFRFCRSLLVLNMVVKFGFLVNWMFLGMVKVFFMIGLKVWKVLVFIRGIGINLVFIIVDFWMGFFVSWRRYFWVFCWVILELDVFFKSILV